MQPHRRDNASGSPRPPRRRAPLPAITFPEELPVSGRREDIARAIESHQVVIVSGETGSGKTTQLPKICLALGRGERGLIGHTQPRRIAASTIARRIAQELGTPPGEVVGYKVRFTDHTRPGASIKLMTDGILLAETQGDPLLKAYDTLIIDEAHERSLNIDFLLGYLQAAAAAAARPEGDHHVGDDRRRALREALRRRRRAGAGHRGVGPPLSGRGPLPAGQRTRTTPTTAR